ncbi:MAG: ATP-binding cassette domain-containing protein [Candidatus Nanopelagicales bacterium]
MTLTHSVTLTDVSFQWPDGTPALDHLTGTFGPARNALVGANGTGKTTVLRLIAGELRPTSGSLLAPGIVASLRQGVTHGASTVADLLGIAGVRTALRAIECGSTDLDHFDAVADRWDIEERAHARLDALGVPSDLDRSVGTLSGGEAMLTAIVGVWLRGADITLLDEPTNNLDVPSRTRVYQAIQEWSGCLIVVSHDLQLLDLMDTTTELRDGSLTTFGGPYREFRTWRDAQDDTARQQLRTATQAFRHQQRERIKAEERIAHSRRKGRKDRANRKFVGAAIDDRRNSAEKSQGSRRTAADARVDAARRNVAAAECAVRDDDHIHVDLPDPEVPAGRRIAELPGAGGTGHVIHGPERVALTGANGVGKTTLLVDLLRRLPVTAGYLPQRIVLDGSVTVLESVRECAPQAPPGELRSRLARLLITGDMVHRTVGSLSGGERFRVALARILLADPPAQLLVLDEPTNDLDLASVDQLVRAVDAFRGALLVVSHDQRFLDRLDLDVTLDLSPDGRLSVSR